MTVNEEYLRSGLLVGQKKKFETSLWAMGNCEKHFHYLFTFCGVKDSLRQ